MRDISERKGRLRGRLEVKMTSTAAGSIMGADVRCYRVNPQARLSTLLPGGGWG